MSSAVISTSAAWSRHFVFDEEAAEERPPAETHKKPAGTEESTALNAFQSKINNQQSTIAQIVNRKSPIANSILPASQLAIRPAPEMVSSGIAALDSLTGGLPRGCLTEICGPASSGRTTVLLSAVAAATRRGEFCAVVDASDALDPHSVAAAGVDLDRLLWVRCGADLPRKENSPRNHRGAGKTKLQAPKTGCPISAAPFAAEVGTSSQAIFDFNQPKSRTSEHRLEQVLRSTDLLLESGGFGLIVLDLADLTLQDARRIPLSMWFRFRRAVEHKPTMLLVIEQYPVAGSCSSLRLRLQLASPKKEVQNGAAQISHGQNAKIDGSFPAHASLFSGLDIHVELASSRLDRKPVRSVMFATRTAWAG